MAVNVEVGSELDRLTERLVSSEATLQRALNAYHEAADTLHERSVEVDAARRMKVQAREALAFHIAELVHERRRANALGAVHYVRGGGDGASV